MGSTEPLAQLPFELKIQMPPAGAAKEVIQNLV